MLIPKKNRVAIYEYLFKEGVMVAKKDFNLPKHPDVEGVPNLQVIKAALVLYTNSNHKFIYKLTYVPCISIRLQSFVSLKTITQVVI